MIGMIVTIAKPTAEDRDAVLAPLVTHNKFNAEPTNPIPVAMLNKDKRGKTIGAPWGDAHPLAEL